MWTLAGGDLGTDGARELHALRARPAAKLLALTAAIALSHASLKQRV